MKKIRIDPFFYIVTFLFCSLFFIGCSNDDTDEQTPIICIFPPQYIFTFDGEVLSKETQEPIAGIGMSIVSFRVDGNEYKFSGDTLYTDASGKINSKMGFLYFEKVEISLKFMDNKNEYDGAFESKEIQIEIIDPDPAKEELDKLLTKDFGVIELDSPKTN